MANPHSFRDMWRKLRKFDKQFEIHKQRGKGSHRMLSHPNVNGEKAYYPVVCHNEGAEISPVYLKVIIRRFDLPDDFFG